MPFKKGDSETTRLGSIGGKTGVKHFAKIDMKEFNSDMGQRSVVAKMEKKFPNLKFEIDGKSPKVHIVAHYKNGKSVEWEVDRLNNKYFRERLKYFNDNGSMKGY